MGAEMIIDSVPYESEGFIPDWNAGKAKIIELVKDGQIIEDDEEFMQDNLEEFKEIFLNGSRESAVHTVGSYSVILTGGSS